MCGAASLWQTADIGFMSDGESENFGPKSGMKKCLGLLVSIVWIIVWNWFCTKAFSDLCVLLMSNIGLHSVFELSPKSLRAYTIRYDTRCYFNVRSKADISQLNLPHYLLSTALIDLAEVMGEEVHKLRHSNSGKKVSIRFDSRYRIDFFRFDYIRQSDKFAACTLIFK